VVWNSTAETCSPDVCKESKIFEIPGYNNAIAVDLIKDITIYDSYKARKCLQGKFIVCLGDSTMTETVHDIIFLLTRLHLHSDLFRNYFDHCVTHFSSDPSFEVRVPNEVNFTLWKDKSRGHRNLTFSLPEYGIYIRHRFTGASSISNNGEGIPGVFKQEVIREFECLTGEPSSGCRKPDILIAKSGHHDITHCQASVEAMPLMFGLLRNAKDRGTRVFWVSTLGTPIPSKLEEMKYLNAAARRYSTLYGITYIDAEIASDTFYSVMKSQSRFQTVHYGAIANGANPGNLIYSSYLTQNILHHWC